MLVLACTCKLASLETELRTCYQLVRRELPSVVEWIVSPPTKQHKDRYLTKYWDLFEAFQRTELPFWTKLATVK